ncbi:hypothetical protein C8F01DRAFT_1161807 [Mycena amicta]|nr:hypothetical protein C8F01DRAFT_1161807 [Mycena amicta]
MSQSLSRSPSPKRVKIETPPDQDLPATNEDSEAKIDEDDDDRCSICLQDIVDRTVVPVCSHEFCFDCLLVWTDQSRRCPLCSQAIGEFLIHKIRSRYDYQKHFLAPLTTSPGPLQPLPPRQQRAPPREPHENEEADRLDRSIVKRRWIYEHGLYAKHVASNSYTRYRPYPTPAQFAAAPDQIARTVMFLRRELQVWVNLDVEFLTNFTISLMKAIDIRSESAVKLLAEFLDLDAPYVEGERHVNAEHFAHEVYSFVRSPYKDLFVYDNVVQYDVPAAVPPPAANRRRRRWHESQSPSVSPEGRRRRRSRSPSASRSRSRDRRLDEHTSRASGTGQPRLNDEPFFGPEISGKHDLKGKGRARAVSDESSISLGSAASVSAAHSPSPPPPPSGRDSGLRQNEETFLGSSRRNDARHRNVAQSPLDTTAYGQLQQRLPSSSLDHGGATGAVSSSADAGSLEDNLPTATSRDIPVTNTPSKKETSKRPGEASALALSTAPRRPPRVRHRSLLESVQAHLSARPADRTIMPRPRPTRTNTNAASSSSSSFDREQQQQQSPPPPGPSLLLRMSDPGTGLVLPLVSTKNQHGFRRRLSPDQDDGARTEILEAKYSHNDNLTPSGPGVQRLSAPEIMALTRARQARLGVPLAATTPLSLVAATLPSLPSSSGSGSVQDGGASGGSNNDTVNNDAATRRTALLQRLEEEKEKARIGGGGGAGKLAATGVEIVSRGSESDVHHDHGHSPAAAADHPAAVEARLRKKAQLRVRLAAEKRRYAQTPIS